MLISFPLQYTAKKPEKFIHMAQSFKIPHKLCDYFTTTGEKIARKKVKSPEKGFFGL